MSENVTNVPIYRGNTHSFKGKENVILKRDWGEPLMILIATMDKVCPNCDFSTRDDMGLRLGYENGKIFGGRCGCGWTFVTDWRSD